MCLLSVRSPFWRLLYGGEFQVNIYSTDLQFGPIVKYNSDGNLFFAWTSFGQDGYTEGVYGRIFR
jgi:hypothetical protein